MKDNKSNTIFLLLKSLNHHYGGNNYQRIEADIRFEKQDWDTLSAEAEALGYSARGLLERRLEEAIKCGNPAARIEHIRDQRRFQDGYSEFWAPFVKYLIIAHLSVIGGGFIVELILSTGRDYIFFYWMYLFSLALAITALLGFRLKKLLESRTYGLNEESGILLEIKFAKISETLMWASFIVFSLSLLGRIALGIYHAISYFDLARPV